MDAASPKSPAGFGFNASANPSPSPSPSPYANGNGSILASKPNELTRKSSMRSSIPRKATPLRHEGRECTRESVKENALRPSSRASTASSTSPDSELTDSAERLRPSFATHTYASHRRTQSTLSESKHPRLHRSNSSITSLRSAYTPETPRDNPRLLRSKTTTPGASASARIHSALQANGSPSMRQPIGLAEAFQLAQQQEVVNSPLLDDTIDLIEAFQRANAEYSGGGRFQGSPSPAPRTLRLKDGSPITISTDAFLASNKDGRDLTQRLQQFDPKHQLSRRASTNFAGGQSFKDQKISGETNRNGEQRVADVMEHDPEMDEDMRSTTPTANRRATQQWPGTHHDDPLPSIEDEDAFDQEQPTPARHRASWSPEKSLNWNLEAEFTAGDLQISDSPRITNGRGRPQLQSYTSEVHEYAVNGTPDFRRSNNRLDRIRERESEIAGMNFPERPTTKLDDIRARERTHSSPRAVANSKLDEIRARNSEARSASPEMVRRAMNDELEDPTWPIKPNRGFDALETNADDHNPNTEQTANVEDAALKNRIHERSVRRRDSQELLRRLSHVTTTSPARRASLSTAAPLNGTISAVKEEETEAETDELEKSRANAAFEEAKSQIRDGKAFQDRPTIGHAGIRRVQSSCSIRDKRPSAVQSETDPTDRIEAEMSLFAPLDNFSEKGSVRTSSQGSSEPGDEDTPRVARIDPLTMPTPRVTGAYVETPATTRVNGSRKARGSWRLFSHVKNAHSPAGKSPLSKGATPRDPRVPSGAQRRSSSMPSFRRARSRSRSRPPPINSAKKFSVKDDLRAIMKEQQIEDSTLDEFDGILEKTECDEDELEQDVNSTLLKVEDKSVPRDSSDRDRELEQLERVLLGIRDSKQGIARLEDRVAHSEKAASQAPEAKIKAESSPPRDILSIPTPLVSPDRVVVSMPRLFQQGTRRPTKLGLCTLVFGTWLLVEGAFTQVFSGPQYACTPATPCEWSPNEPYFPYTMPFMLDEWTTGGQGRSLVWKLGEDLGDTVADVSDWITNNDFSQQDQRYMGVWERKRHRRRLRKHGLVPKWVEPPQYQGKSAAWHAAAARRHSSATVRDEAYEYQTNDEKMDADETI
ncbi:hypothetical protein MN608_03988 [Microdochium nivale]|nr:hypothetical protein MN608_03988 [Microdochium nivale]